MALLSRLLPLLATLLCLSHVVVAGRVAITSTGAAEVSEGTALPVVLWHGEIRALGHVQRVHVKRIFLAFYRRQQHRIMCMVQPLLHALLILLFCARVRVTGMGDSCCSMGSIGSVAKLIEDELGVFVYSIATGAGEYKDIWSSFYGGFSLVQGLGQPPPIPQ
jgi:hypothetical protein